VFTSREDAVRVGEVDGQFVLNPTYEQRENSPIDLIVVGHKDGIVMIEGESNETPEERVVEALQFAEKEMQPLRDIQEEFRKKVGVDKAEVQLSNPHPDLKKKVAELAQSDLASAYEIAEKEERETACNKVLDDLLADLSVFDELKEEDKDISGDIKSVFDEVEYDLIREKIFKEEKRADGRGLKDVRELSVEINVLPRTHGSGLFTRGQTQSLGVVTLGTKRDEQLVEALDGVSYNNFMLHYNFPSFSVVKTIKAPVRPRYCTRKSEMSRPKKPPLANLKKDS